MDTEPKKRKKRVEKVKRIMYPWLKKRQSRCYKCMLSLIASRIGFKELKSGDINFSQFVKKVVNETDQIIPTMYIKVKKYYKSKGRDINKKQFVDISSARLTMMIRYDRKKKKMLKLREHPDKNIEKLGKSVKTCIRILKSGKTYEEYFSDG
jgi:hypothetical protein